MKKLCIFLSLEGPVESHIAVYIQHKIWSQRWKKREIIAQKEEFLFFPSKPSTLLPRRGKQNLP